MAKPTAPPTPKEEMEPSLSWDQISGMADHGLSKEKTPSHLEGVSTETEVRAFPMTFSPFERLKN